MGRRPIAGEAGYVQPANILLDEHGTALLSDLGLACFIPLASAHTRLSGTPAYLAPELLAAGAAPTTASDLYALGVTLFALLTGEAPVPDTGSTADRHRRLPDPRRWQAGLDAPVLQLLADLTAILPDDRPRHAQAVLDRLDLMLGRLVVGYHPPAGRDGDLAPAARQVAEDPTTRLVLETVPGPALVVEGHRQVLAANAAAVALVGAADARALVGRRPGELLGCAEAAHAPDGCGTGIRCACCGLGRALSEAEQGRPLPIEGDCHIAPADPARPGWDLAWRMQGLAVDGMQLRAIGMRDIAPERRRRSLERVLLRDILASAAAVDALAAGGDVHALANASRALVEGIADHERLAAAEAGELQPLWEPVDLAGCVAAAVARWGAHPLAEGRRLAGCNLAQPHVVTDRAVLATALGHLLRNALEACPDGGTVGIGAVADGDGGAIEIRNPGHIPDAVRARLFRPADAQATQGIGTWAARLLVEGHLRGRIAWRSAEGKTLFRIELPRQP